MSKPPATITLCARWRDGAHCLGQVHAGKCIRCGRAAETATYVLEERLETPVIVSVSSCAHVALNDQGGGQVFAACEPCRGEEG